MANDVVLVPNYSDPMDSVANEIIQGLYPNRVVVGINCQNILLWGGMVHCVTQQQPLGSSLMSFNDHSNHAETEEPVILFDLMGRQVWVPQFGTPYLKVYSSGRVEKLVSWE